MLDRCIDVVFAALLLTFFLPLLAWYSIHAALDARTSKRSRARIFKTDHTHETAGELSFDRAIAAYEELIDRTFADGRP